MTRRGLDRAGESATPSLRSVSEELALLARLRAGDEEAFSALVGRHHHALLRLASVFVPNKEIAEEVVQDTWAAVISGLDGFEGRSSLKTWIFRILTNRARTRGTREARSIPFSALRGADEDHEPAVEPNRFRSDGTWRAAPRQWNLDTPERLMMRKEAISRLESAVEDLPANQRAIVTLRDVEGLGAAEVCNILRISETNQRVLLHRARVKLRRVLEEYFDRADG